jgi:hypothetical protein
MVLTERNEVGQQGQSFTWNEFLPQLFSSTFENWQSEFLQLVWQAAGLAILLLGSSQSRNPMNGPKRSSTPSCETATSTRTSPDVEGAASPRSTRVGAAAAHGRGLDRRVRSAPVRRQ